MKVYLAGPMSGHPQHNFPIFDEAKETLESYGVEVVSPADIDREFGLTGEEQQVDRELLVKVMLKELQELSQCDAVVTLPNSRKSKGVAVEKAWARCLGIPIYYIVPFVQRKVWRKYAQKQSR